MSKKGKLILATAVFGAALFAASCGGGDNGGTTAGGGSGGSGGGGGTEPTEEGRVLALLNVGSASAGFSRPVTICQLKSDNKAYCGSDLNPTADVELEYLYEFGNGNVVLKDTSDVLYFFNGSQVIRPTSYRTLGGISDLNAPSGITTPTGTVTYYATPNFLIIHGTGANNIGNNLVVVTREGKVISDNVIALADINTSCEAVTQGANTFKLNTDGTSTTTNIPTTLTSAGGKFLVQDSSNQIRLSDSECSATGVFVDTISVVNDAQMVKVGSDTFYIAVRDNTALRYYRVSGTTPTPLNTSISLHSTGTNEYYYALDGRGVLYAITGANTVSVYRNTDGQSAGTATVTGATFTGLLGFADRVLAKAGTDVYEITTNGSVANAVNRGGGALYTALDSCTDANDTKAIDGMGTNFVRCVFDDGATRALYSLTYNSGSNTYGNASGSLTGAFGDALFAPNKVLVKAGTTIHLCNTTTTPTISCSSTDLPDLDPTNINTNKYLKFNGNNVFYAKDNAGNTVNPPKVGDIFGPPSGLPITVTNPSGGNASFDLTRFAFSFEPATAPSGCNTQIVYLSSPTASQKFYTITQPSNACVKRILKVY